MSALTRGRNVLAPREASLPRPPAWIWTFARLVVRDLRDSLTSRWFILYGLAFVVLGLGISYVSAMAGGSSGVAGFGRTSAGLVNLVILIVPLMALTAGASSIASERERGSLAYLLAQPVTRLEVLGARFTALGLALAACIVGGLGLCGVILAWRGAGTDPTALVRLASLSTLLALATLAPGMLISAASSRGGVATGVAIFAWLILVFGSDLGLMATATAVHMKIGDLFSASLSNPLQVFKMWAIGSTDATLDILGPAGLYGSDRFGPRLPLVFAGAMAAWVVVPAVAAAAIFRWRSPV